MMIANSQKNRAATAAWCNGLRNEVSDKPWVSTAALTKIERADTLALTARTIESGPQSLALAAQKPRCAVRREIWQSQSPKQLSQVHDSIKKNCEQRIEIFRQELSVLNSRNATIRAHIEHFKREECVPAIADYMSNEESPSHSRAGSKPSSPAGLKPSLEPSVASQQERGRRKQAAVEEERWRIFDEEQQNLKDSTRKEADRQAVVVLPAQREADAALKPPTVARDTDADPDAPSTSSTLSVFPVTAAAPVDDTDDVAVPAG